MYSYCYSAIIRRHRLDIMVPSDQCFSCVKSLYLLICSLINILVILKRYLTQINCNSHIRRKLQVILVKE